MNNTLASTLLDEFPTRCIQEMLVAVVNSAINWQEPSRVDHTESRAVVWNRMTKRLRETPTCRVTALRLIHEFGEYCPTYHAYMYDINAEPHVRHEEPITTSIEELYFERTWIP